MEIGFVVQYNPLTDNTLSFDNVRRGFAVPEPQSCAAMGAMLIGLCTVYRRRIREVASAAARLPWAV